MHKHGIYKNTENIVQTYFCTEEESENINRDMEHHFGLFPHRFV